jgi:hypothetical protein
MAVAVALGVAGCSGNASAPTADEGPLLVGLPYSSYAHEGEPFARELFTEHASKVGQTDDDELYYVGSDVDLRYTHVEDLARRSRPAVPGAPVVWFLGGSTMFGLGQRDEHTIPSEVARIAEEAGTPITAVNFGWSSYVAWQEAGLLRRLVAERGSPDLIVFLHGINDLSSLCRRMGAGIGPLQRTNPLTERDLSQGAKVLDCLADPSSTGAVLAGVVDAAMLEAEAMAPGVPMVEFWQPAAYTRAPFPSEDELLARMKVDRASFDAQRDAYLAALEVDRTPPVDLTDVFDSRTEAIFFDWAHTNELGARLVAQGMWDRALQDAVADLG